MAERQYYMVRAQQAQEEDFKIFLENNVVAVGWSDVDFSAFATAEELKREINKKYCEGGQKAKNVVSRKLNEAFNFKSMKKGDYVIVPYYTGILLAEVGEREIYSKSAYERDLSNQRQVAYRRDEKGKATVVLRKELSDKLQRRLRLRGSTVLTLFEFCDEIEDLFSKQNYSYPEKIFELTRKEEEEFKKKLLENIQSGKTNLQAGGIGLENLVRELMECEGYTAKVLPKNKFKGHADADISATKDDPFSSRRIFVQVKHHTGESGPEGVRQIIDVLKQPEYQDCQGYFVTSAKISKEARELAEENSIGVMDGDDLAELIVTNIKDPDIKHLSPATKTQLGISEVPHIMDI